jgi:AAA+ ATPase superfamily predicted ATPase
MDKDNPFSLAYNPGHFCDRKQELKHLESNTFNGINTVIHSPRRLGKSFLIRHLFHQLEKEDLVKTIYVDLFATSNMQDLIQNLSRKVLDAFYGRNLFKGIEQVLKGLSPTVSFDRDGAPKFSLEINPKQYDTSLEQLFSYLEKRNKKVLIAFDEFQEVAGYPEKAEAMLRSHIQTLTNVNFIFSGSTGHMLQEMFLGAKRPFYQSADVLVLGKIEREIYHPFIADTFLKGGKTIEPDAIDFILDFTEVHTYYTEMLCNICYSQSKKTLTPEMAKDMAIKFLENRKFDYLNILNLMTENQKKLLKAVALEGEVSKPNANEFLRKHNLPAASSINQALKVLLDKEILFQTVSGYRVYDVFLRRFIEQYFGT